MLAVLNADVQPLTGTTANTEYSEDDYLSFLKRAEEDLLMNLPVDLLTGLGHHYDGNYTAGVNYKVLETFTPVFRRMCEDGVRTGGREAHMLTRETRSFVRAGAHIWDPYVIHAWFLRVDGKIEFFPISHDHGQSFDIDFDYIRKQKTMIVSGPAGPDQVLTSELPEVVHELMMVRAEQFMYEGLEIDKLATTKGNEYLGRLRGLGGQVERYPGGASV